MKNLTAFERVMWPAMAERVRQMLETPAGKIRGADRLKPESGSRSRRRRRSRRSSKPKKARKLLVTDIQMYSGHTTIPHGNLLLELMAKNTGAFEPTFSNDLNLLKYPKIKEFDAVYLNNVCGMVYNDPEVREGILRFVREGGGIGGTSRRDVRQQQLARVRRHDGRLGRRAPHREAGDQDRRPGQPADEVVRVGELRAHRRVLPVPAMLAVLAREAAHPA